MGSLTFSGDPSNYFDPGYGFVPPTGYLNSVGTTVAISDTAVEFGFDDGSSRIAADFSDSQIAISDLTELSGPINSFVMTFTDTAFTGQYLVPVSDTFTLASYSLVGDVVAFDYAGGNPSAGQTFAATLTVAPIPEPSTCGFVSLSLLAGASLLRARGKRARNQARYPRA
jgi:hypothetical protein